MKAFKNARAQMKGITVRHIVSGMLLWMCLTTALVFAQSNKLETDQGIAAAIAPYDADVRQSILLASQYPKILTQLQTSQTQTATSFQEMISGFRQEKQEWFYTVTRYPDLMHQLATLPKGQTQADVYKLLPYQEPALQEAAWKLYRNQKSNLAKLDNIRMSADREFEKSISPLSASARQAFHKLETMPDVLTLLTNNINLTTRLGEQYKNNPGPLTSQLTTLHDKLEIENQREAAAFKKQMENDPKAMKELRQAANDYPSNTYYNNPYYYPYSYWFGYPYWYSYPMWYPGMYWYSPGFAFGTNGLYGFPSYGFSLWFYNGGYYARYPHVYRQFRDYYHSSVTTTRVTSTVNRGFMGVAATHYRPFNGGVNTQMNVRTSPSYNRQGQLLQNRPNYNSHWNANSFHNQSWGSYGGRGNSIGVGGSMGGGLRVGGRGRH